MFSQAAGAASGGNVITSYSIHYTKLYDGETDPPKTFLSRLSAALPGFAPVGEGLYRADLPSGTLWLLFRGGYCLGMAGRVDP